MLVNFHDSGGQLQRSTHLVASATSLLYISSLAFWNCHLPLWRGLPFSSVSPSPPCMETNCRCHLGSSEHRSQRCSTKAFPQLLPKECALNHSEFGAAWFELIFAQINTWKFSGTSVKPLTLAPLTSFPCVFTKVPLIFVELYSLYTSSLTLKMKCWHPRSFNYLPRDHIVTLTELWESC